jgi:hypothetical protein
VSTPESARFTSPPSLILSLACGFAVWCVLAGDDAGVGGGGPRRWCMDGWLGTLTAHGLHAIWFWCHNRAVEIDWPKQFGDWLDRVEADADAGDPHARLVRKYVAEALALLRQLPQAPTRDSESADLKWVRQSRRYELWRVSHPYHPAVAVRLICWFPPGSGTVVVTLFAGDKARIGDVWYGSVAVRADPLVDAWKREVSYDE